MKKIILNEKELILVIRKILSEQTNIENDDNFKVDPCTEQFLNWLSSIDGQLFIKLIKEIKEMPRGKERRHKVREIKRLRSKIPKCKTNNSFISLY